MSINDDEIIGRALGARAIANRGVALLTFGTGRNCERKPGFKVETCTMALSEGSQDEQP